MSEIKNEEYRFGKIYGLKLSEIDEIKIVLCRNYRLCERFGVSKLPIVINT